MLRYKFVSYLLTFHILFTTLSIRVGLDCEDIIRLVFI